MCPGEQATPVSTEPASAAARTVSAFRGHSLIGGASWVMMYGGSRS